MADCGPAQSVLILLNMLLRAAAAVAKEPCKYTHESLLQPAAGIQPHMSSIAPVH